jgi:hypothetical protein
VSPAGAVDVHGMLHLPRRLLSFALVAALVLVALLTLMPEGSGWAWGSPTVELRWYITGLGSAPTLMQLVGNLLLLAPLSALAVLRWAPLRRFVPLAAGGLSTGTVIELLQRLLPIGRVVSPVDAVLNAGGAVMVGLLTARATRSLADQELRPVRGGECGHRPGGPGPLRHAMGPHGRPPEREAGPRRQSNHGRSCTGRS